MSFVREIKSRLALAGLRAYQLADEMGISEATLYRWLRQDLTRDEAMVFFDAIDHLEAKKGGDKNA